MENDKKSALKKTNSIRKNESVELAIVQDSRPGTGKVGVHSGSYFRDGRRKIDFVLVYEKVADYQVIKQESKFRSDRRTFFETNLVNEGVELEVENVTESGKTLVFVKLHSPWSTLCKFAQRLELKMPLNAFDLHDDCHQTATTKRNRSENQIDRYYQKFVDLLIDRKSITPRAAVVDGRFKDSTTGRRLYRPFTIDSLNDFAIGPNRDEFFPDCLRIEIAYEILQLAHNDPLDDKKRGVKSLIDKGIYSTAFPLHLGGANRSGGGGGDDDISAPLNLHNNNNSSLLLASRQRLRVEWASWHSVCRRQPLNDIRDYFGEKIGFYFAFMDFYTKALILPALFGLAALIYGIVYTALSEEMEQICNRNSTPGSYWMCPICQPPDCDPWLMADEGCFKYKWQFRLDNLATFALACFTTLWSIIFLKMWKRRESRLAVEWETHDAEEHEKTIRPEYEATATEERDNPVTLEREKIVPFRTRSLRMTASVLATLVVLFVDGVFLIVLVISRIALYKALNNLGNPHIAEYNVEYSRWIVHGLILLTILIFEKFYLSIAHKLTSYECPKTDKRYMTSLLWKLFIFQLLNDFIPIAYAAWMKQTWVNTPLNLNFVSELCDGGCMAEVAELIAVLLLARLVIGNLQETIVPYVKNIHSRRVHRSSDTASDAERAPQWLEDFKLNEVELDGVYEEYMEMMVQFAFIVLFTPAFPVASLVCFGNNILEIRVDAMKLLIANRRPLPIRVPGVQIWNRFMDIIIKVGIVCNAALIAFTSDTVPRLYFRYLEFNKNDSYTGYTQFSLSRVEVDGWLTSPGHKDAHIDHCYYQDFREPDSPYKLRLEVWIISTARVAVFSAYCIVFLVAMWICNTFIDDVPEDVRDLVKRHQFLMATKTRLTDSASSSANFDGIRSEASDTNGNKRSDLEPRRPSITAIKAMVVMENRYTDANDRSSSPMNNKSSVPVLPPITPNKSHSVVFGIPDREQ